MARLIQSNVHLQRHDCVLARLGGPRTWRLGRVTCPVCYHAATRRASTWALWLGVTGAGLALASFLIRAAV